MEIIGGIILAWLIAEIISGVIHFIEDSYCKPEWKESKNTLKQFIYKNITAPNILHHQRPAAMLEGNFWQRNNTSIIPAWIIALCIYLLGPTYWPIWLGFILMGFANELHGWSHQKCSKPIQFLQSIGILQHPKHHKIHHTRPYSQRYCVMSGWVNPILEFLYFWPALRIMIWLLTGAKPLESRKND